MTEDEERRVLTTDGAVGATCFCFSGDLFSFWPYYDRPFRDLDYYFLGFRLRQVTYLLAAPPKRACL